MLLSFIHFHIFSTINQTYIMIIFNYNLVIVFFFDFNIIFNLSHPSNHSQILTSFTLNPLLSPLIHLKWTTQTSHSNPLEFIIPSPSNQTRQWVMGRMMKIPRFLSHISYAMIWGWYQNYSYIGNLFFSLIMTTI